MSITAKHVADICHFTGNLMTILVGGEQTDGRYALLLGSMAPGDATPPFVDSAAAETLVVVAGSLTVDTPGQSTTYYPGQNVILKPEMPHRMRNTGRDDATYLILCTPAAHDKIVGSTSNRLRDAVASLRLVFDQSVGTFNDLAPTSGLRPVEEAAAARLGTLPSMPLEVLAAATFYTLGSVIKVLSTYGDGDEAPVLLCVTPTPRQRGVGALKEAPQGSTAVDFFAATSGLRANSCGTLPTGWGPALIAVATRRSLGELCKLVHPKHGLRADQALHHVREILEACHGGAASGGFPSAARAAVAATERRGFPIY
jgi:quercetin dioxygenase-like cupin family protein